MSVTLMDATLRLVCILDPSSPWDIEMSPFPSRQRDYDQAIQYLKGSKKASEIIEAIISSPHEFKVMVTDNYMNKYWSPGELAKVYKTKFNGEASLVTWNSKERGNWFAIAEHQPPDFVVPASHPSVQNIKTPSPAILLIHEFGHGLQYLADKDGYEGKRAATYIQPDGPNVDLLIENDNLRKHEAPVCLELGEQVRWQYWDTKKPKGPYVPPTPRQPEPNLRGLGPREPQLYSGLGVGRRENVRG